MYLAPSFLPLASLRWSPCQLSTMVGAWPATPPLTLALDALRLWDTTWEPQGQGAQELARLRAQTSAPPSPPAWLTLGGSRYPGTPIDGQVLGEAGGELGGAGPAARASIRPIRLQLYKPEAETTPKQVILGGPIRAGRRPPRSPIHAPHPVTTQR